MLSAQSWALDCLQATSPPPVGAGRRLRRDGTRADDLEDTSMSSDGEDEALEEVSSSSDDEEEELLLKRQKVLQREHAKLRRALEKSKGPGTSTASGSKRGQQVAAAEGTDKGRPPKRTAAGRR